MSEACMKLNAKELRRFIMRLSGKFARSVGESKAEKLEMSLPDVH